MILLGDLLVVSHSINHYTILVKVIIIKSRWVYVFTQSLNFLEKFIMVTSCAVGRDGGTRRNSDFLLYVYIYKEFC